MMVHSLFVLLRQLVKMVMMLCFVVVLSLAFAYKYVSFHVED